MDSPLIGAGRTKAIAGQIGTLADAHASMANQQKNITSQIVATKKLRLEELILLGDGDSEPLLTECAMERAARRYTREDRTIRIAFAPAGLDFNDLLRGEAA